MAKPDEPGCPSDLVYDQLLGDELGAARSAEVRRHVADCSRCRARFEELARFREEARLPAFESFARPSARARAKWPVYAAGAAAAAAFALGLLLWVRPAPVPDETRAKGTGRLSFYVKRGEAVLRGGPGEILHPGDAIEFSYTAVRPGYLAVLSVDGARRASVYYPDAARAAPVTAGEQILPQSTVLDDVLGTEHLYAVFCDGAVELEPLRRALERDPRAGIVAGGCSVDSLIVEKKAR
jgi:hypothetical protein